MARITGALRLIELLASLSLATDLATGQPMGHGIRTCLLAVRLARAMGCEDEMVRTVQQVALLRFLGCTADAGELARQVGGNELSFNRAMAPVLYGGAGESLSAVIGSVGVGSPALRRFGLIAGVVADRGGSGKTLSMHCEVASMLSRRLGLADEVTTSLAHAYERWDGGGYPDGLVGEEIPLAIRICTVARDIDLLSSQDTDPTNILTERRGLSYDPSVVDVYTHLDDRTPEADWDTLLESEPLPERYTEDLDVVLEVMADFADLKSRWTRGHSRRVASLAEGAAVHGGLDADEILLARRSGLIHDLGRVGVENGVWDKPSTLSVDEWERVRLHPYLTDRILARCSALQPLSATASSHHERMDGNGYHRGIGAGQLSLADQLLAGADVFDALTSDRPYRPALSEKEAADMLRNEATDGRLHPSAVSNLLAVIGVSPTSQIANPGGLTDREVEVLRLITRELSNKQMAELLFISPKTVGRHVENIYAKIGVSTRAGAAVYAMAHRLV